MTPCKECKKTDLFYLVECDYVRGNWQYDDGYGRDTTIEDAHVTDIPVHKVIDALKDKHFHVLNEIDDYCFDRLCISLGVYIPSNYEIEICPGYYGEEIEAIFFEGEEELVNKFEKILNMTNTADKLKYVLCEEYGYLLETIEDVSEASVQAVPKNKIYIPNKEYYRKLQCDAIKAYEGYDKALAVCTCDSDTIYRVIDGYHRMAANPNLSHYKVIILK